MSNAILLRNKENIDNILRSIPDYNIDYVIYLGDIDRKNLSLSNDIKLFTANIKYIEKLTFFSHFSFGIGIAEALQISNLIIDIEELEVSKITYDANKYIHKLQQLVDIGTINNIHLSFPLIKNFDNLETKIHCKEYENNNCLILFSGGIDCSVVSYMLADKYKKLVLLFMNYGQTNYNIEHECSKKIEKELFKITDISYNEVCLKNYYEKINFSSDLLKPNVKLEEINKIYEYVPFRNTIFIGISLEFCNIFNINTIATGSQRDDNISPDNSIKYYEIINEVISLQYSTSEIKVVPFLLNIGGKKEIIKLGNSLGINFVNCWTCHNEEVYINGKIHQCGKCSDCKTRFFAFKELGLEDPIEYLNTPNKY
ncbi:7-cyano-7-deazaguanine synthase [Clostridioides sp. ES-S-0108-01]|uniref:7-cyano-7-deazaguanine synthase n=1 Tax=Clostridioides sp. ES-S-0108-01 TaxID=2770773 RepID=UPI001D0C349D|nr:7-cyano-7-deazaguanine synthase [Clostridioides sp. ES-S-0108-01]UDN51716.1 7-cyano-7-deazaguanine synthase [Clostridioides sp. ES-S-0107-01]